MATTYGSFPGVRVNVAGGGITAVAIGEEEKLVLFGEASYEDDDTFGDDGEDDPLDEDLTGSLETAETINARREADETFGEDSELAQAMREALANGANINFLYGVAPRRFNVVDEVQSTQSDSLSNETLWEEDVSDESNIEAIRVTDGVDLEEADDADYLNVEYDYTSPPAQPDAEDTVAINPLTGEFAADDSPDSEYQFSYKYIDWQSAFDAKDVEDAINEDETAIFAALSDSDPMSSSLDGTARTYRQSYKLVNALSGAQPNDNEVVTSDDKSLEEDHSNYTRRDAHYDTGDFSRGSVDADYYFKFAPVREDNSSKTILGGIAGLFAGNPIDDPIYNDSLSGYDDLEQSFSKADADDMRDEGVIPIRQAGSTRVKDNLSTSTEDDWERDFWRRRIADRVILIGKTVGDAIIGRINDEDTRDSAERLIEQEMRELVGDRLLRPNSEDEEYWYVDVYESSSDPDEVKIDIGFTPYGIVKRVEETITINT